MPQCLLPTVGMLPPQADGSPGLRKFRTCGAGRGLLPSARGPAEPYHPRVSPKGLDSSPFIRRLWDREAESHPGPRTKAASVKKVVCPVISRKGKEREERQGEGSASVFLSLSGPLRVGRPAGTRGGCETPSWYPCPSVREGRGHGWNRETEETVRQQSSRQTDGEAPRGDRRPSPAQPASGCRVGVYLVCNSSRAFLPQPQGWGHGFQHLKHVIVTDAPTGDPAQRGRGSVGSTGRGAAGGEGEEADKKTDPVNQRQSTCQKSKRAK